MVIAVLLALAGCSGSGEPGQQPGIGDPGGPPSVEGPRPRGNLQKQPIGSVVLAAGRAPDGARYEFVLETFAEPTESDPSSENFGQCLNLEWPDARVGQISPEFGCYPEFPPAAVDEAVVKRGGAIFDPSYTTHVQIAGLAGSGVGEVRILYKDEHGAKHDAPVHFASVTGDVQERAGADRPFGVFIGFLPQAWLGYGASYDTRHCPPEEHPLRARGDPGDRIRPSRRADRDRDRQQHHLRRRAAFLPLTHRTLGAPLPVPRAARWQPALAPAPLRPGRLPRRRPGLSAQPDRERDPARQPAAAV